MKEERGGERIKLRSFSFDNGHIYGAGQSPCWFGFEISGRVFEHGTLRVAGEGGGKIVHCNWGLRKVSSSPRKATKILIPWLQGSPRSQFKELSLIVPLSIWSPSMMDALTAVHQQFCEFLNAKLSSLCVVDINKPKDSKKSTQANYNNVVLNSSGFFTMPPFIINNLQEFLTVVLDFIVAGVEASVGIKAQLLEFSLRFNLDDSKTNEPNCATEVLPVTDSIALLKLQFPQIKYFVDHRDPSIPSPLMAELQCSEFYTLSELYAQRMKMVSIMSPMNMNGLDGELAVDFVSSLFHFLTQQQIHALDIDCVKLTMPWKLDGASVRSVNRLFQLAAPPPPLANKSWLWFA